MDAAPTLYVIVLLANGDVRTAGANPTPSYSNCTVEAKTQRHGWLADDFRRRGVKSVMFYCAPPRRPRTLVIAR